MKINVENVRDTDQTPTNADVTIPHRSKGQRVRPQIARMARPTDENNRVSTQKNRAMGQVFVEEWQSIAFEINGQTLILPQKERLVIGRHSGSNAEKEPDVALDAFNAEKQGVSRRHLRLQRAGEIVYVRNLSASNGTVLNGLVLSHHSNAILRNGDELRLGRLTVRVVFTSVKQV